MAFTFSVFTEEVPAATAADAEVTVTPVTDLLLPIMGSQFQIPRPMRLVGAWAGAQEDTNGANPSVFRLNDARLLSPAFATVANPSVRALGDIDSTPDAGRLTLDDLAMEPLPLRGGDGIGAVVRTSELTVDAFRAWVAILLSEGLEPIPPGQGFWVRYRQAFNMPSTGAGAWQPGTILFDQTLPSAKYGILGIDHVQTNSLFVRAALAGTPLRPGTLTLPGPTSRRSRLLDTDQLGIWGTFDSFAPPSLEVLGYGTLDADFYGWMRLIRLS